MSSSDAPTFVELSRHLVSLRSLARHLVGSEHDADDLLQDACARYLVRPPRVAGAVRGWFATVMRRLASDGRRASGRRVARERTTSRPEGVAPQDGGVEQMEVGQRLVACVLALPEPYRSVIYLRHWEGLEPTEIAVRCGVPVKTVKTRLARGLARLRVALDAGFGGRREAWFASLLPLALGRDAAVSVASASGAASGAGLVGGALVMKQVVAVLVVLAVGALVWWRGLLTPAPVATPSAPHAVPTPTAERASPSTGGNAVVPKPFHPGDAAESRADTQPATGALTVKLKWSDGSAAGAIALVVQCVGDPAPRDERFHARTDDAGEAHFDTLFAGAVSIDSDRGPRFEADVKAGETRTVELTLPKAEGVAGKVVDSDGRPVADASIFVSDTLVADVSPIRGRTGADGSFFIRDVNARRSIGARAAGFQPSTLFQVGEMPVDTAGVRTVTLTLGPPGGAVAGRVVDPAGAPVAGAQVKVGPRGGHIIDLPSGVRGTAPQPVAVITDADGRFTYPGALPPGDQPVSVTARGWPNWSGSVAVKEGETATMEIALETPATIVGRVVDASGAAVPGANVVESVEHQGGWHFDAFPAPRAVTDADGGFTLRWVPPGLRELNGRVGKRPDLGRATVKAECAAGRTTEVTLKLDPGATIEGRVQDKDGHPLRGWKVYADPDPYGMTYPRQAETREDGGFVLANLDEQYRYNVTVAAPRSVPIPPRAERKSLRPRTRDLVLVVTDTALADGRVRGRVVDEAGRPPKDVQLTIRPVGGNQGLFVDMEEATGAFDHGDVSAGRYTLQVIRGGMTLLTSPVIEVPAGATVDAGTLSIEKPGRIEVVLVGGVAPEDFRPWLNRDGHGTVSFERDGSIFRSADLAPGTWRLGAAPGSRFIRAQDIQLVAGETRRVEIHSEAAFEVDAYLVLPESDTKWTVVTCVARDESGAVVWEVGRLTRPALDRGRIQLYGLSLPKGRFTLEAKTDSGLGATDVITVDGPSREAKPRRLEMK